MNVLLYMAQVATRGRLTAWGCLSRSHVDRGEVWRLVTSSLLHANILHLYVNNTSLDHIGRVVEDRDGPRRFLAVYFTSALTGSAMSYCFLKSCSLGASGSIFGLIGSHAVYVMRHKNLPGRDKQLEQIVDTLYLNMAIGLVIKRIDNWGHLGGLLGGAAVSWFI
ncbi:hypothetical protein QJS10_CPB19g01806 [Acorus calamus]|uniref:Peptidase S54 rhomboid domain-containing protein n=2 Tax=Acorus calamus TaxID=4465 RepID=A0AAV9CFB1_ACOCL|nr:hypothetical protein QJS10_CPB19g01806 [Acorus calamus]